MQEEASYELVFRNRPFVDNGGVDSKVNNSYSCVLSTRGKNVRHCKFHIWTVWLVCGKVSEALSADEKKNFFGVAHLIHCKTPSFRKKPFKTLYVSVRAST
jgi:hypothetical protein